MTNETTGMPRYTTPPAPPGETSADAHLQLLADRITAADPGAIERYVIDRGELTLYVERSRLVELAQLCRDDPRLRFEVLASLSGVDYLDYPMSAPPDGAPTPSSSAGRGPQTPPAAVADDRRLHVAYHLLSMTHRHRIRLEVAVTADDPHVASVVGIWPTADWHERETYDFFGIVFDGHPSLTRIQMPDDWEGHPQRKDYPLGGIPVEYKGAEIPPPELRREWA